jgi:hypothetical protein
LTNYIFYFIIFTVVLREKKMPQAQNSPEKPYQCALARDEICFDFVNSCAVEIPRTTLIHALADAIHHCGSDYHGRYIVNVGIADIHFEGSGIQWLPYDGCQRGIGFSFGRVQEGSKNFPSLRCSLRPPEGIDTAQLHFELTGVRPKVLLSRPPALKLVDTVVVEAGAPPDVNTALAGAIQKVSGLKQTLANLLAQEAELDAELPQLEAEAAAAQDVEAQVDARVRQLLQRE